MPRHALHATTNQFARIQRADKMAAINEVIDLSIDDGVAVITSNHPPVNALSAIVRDGLTAAFDKAHGRRRRQGHRAHLRWPHLLCRGRHQRVRQAAKGCVAACAVRSSMEKRRQADRRGDPWHLAGRWLRDRAGVPLPRGRALGTRRPARSQAGSAGRRWRHAAAAAHRRRRQGAGDGDRAACRSAARPRWRRAWWTSWWPKVAICVRRAWLSHARSWPRSGR